MSDILIYVLMAAGFFTLVKGADLLVQGASGFARRMGVQPFIVGMTVVAIGTTVPEFVVSLSASIHGNPGIVIGNALGSNIVNILLIVGISSLILPVVVRRSIYRRQVPIALLATLIVGMFANDVFFGRSSTSTLDAEDGVILLSFFAMFIIYIYNTARSRVGRAEVEESGDHRRFGSAKSLIFILIGILGVAFGGDWVVDGAVRMAGTLGVSETLIGLTLVALGTSLPELTTSVVAALRREQSVALGNIIGANILNLFWILGVSSMITTIPIDDVRNVDILAMVGATALLTYLMNRGGYRIERWHGVLFVSIYAAYIVASFLIG